MNPPSKSINRTDLGFHTPMRTGRSSWLGRSSAIGSSIIRQSETISFTVQCPGETGLGVVRGLELPEFGSYGLGTHDALFPIFGGYERIRSGLPLIPIKVFVGHAGCHIRDV